MQVKTQGPSTPCVRNCCLDDDNVCLGCGRALDEILQWQSVSEMQRDDWLAQAEQRCQKRKRRT